jgi:hypothetical protein
MGFCDEDDFWTELKQLQEITKANIWVMDEDTHSDQYTENYGTPEAKVVTGKNHGRMERQVEFGWRVENMSADQFAELILDITTKTDPIWPTHGVSVC